MTCGLDRDRTNLTVPFIYIYIYIYIYRSTTQIQLYMAVYKMDKSMRFSAADEGLSGT